MVKTIFPSYLTNDVSNHGKSSTYLRGKKQELEPVYDALEGKTVR